MTWNWGTDAGYISDPYVIGQNGMKIYDNYADADGNVYVTGAFRGTLDFGSYQLQQNDGTNYENCFLAKYNSSGNFLWSFKIGYSPVIFGSATSKSVFCDSHKNVYLCGVFQGEIIINSVIFSSSGNDDIFLLKLRPDGSFGWMKQIGSESADDVSKNSVFIDKSDNIILSGIFQSSLLTIGSTVLQNVSVKPDIFISKLDTNGVFIWSHRIGGEGSESLNCIGGNDFRIYLSGSTDSAGFHVGNSYVTDNNFLIALDINGSFIWTKNFPGVDFKPFGIQADNMQNIYLAGDYSGSLTIDNQVFTAASDSDDNIFILKMNSSGTSIRSESLALYPQYNSYYHDIAIDNSANVYIETPFYNINFDTVSISSDICNIIVVKYDSSLVYKNFLKTQTDVYSFYSCIAFGPNGDLFLSGEYFGNYLIAGQDTIISGTYPELWYANIFLVKINSSGPPLEHQQIYLPFGWSIISSYLDPVITSVSQLLNNIIQHVVIVKNDLGQVYWPQYGIDFVGEFDVLSGYQIKMLISDTLTIQGFVMVPEITPINLNTNWHMISYLRKTFAPIVNMMSSITSSLIIVKNDGGEVYWPYYSINTISYMFPGKGYLIRLSSPSSLVYPAN
ncbi:MAG: hypothetical protein NTW49_04955 [Bacteroidia bacterium]|nr:hypothetical protein [Bacteroidia bacterium]